MNDQMTSLPPGNESEIDDDAIGASVKIDWEEIIAADDPGDPEEMLGGVVSILRITRPRKRKRLLGKPSSRNSAGRLRMKPKPVLWFTDPANRDLENCQIFLQRTPGGQPSRKRREIIQATNRLRDSPKLYPVAGVHPISRLEFRRKIVGQFVIIYAYIERQSGGQAGSSASGRFGMVPGRMFSFVLKSHGRLLDGSFRR